MNNLYTYVNYQAKTIDDLAQDLPKNWRNIQGLDLLGNEKISELTWAGHPGFGWVKLSDFDLSRYSCAPEWLELSKNGAKSAISKQRYEAETEAISWRGNLVRINERTKNAINFKLLSSQNKLDQPFSWKFVNKEEIITAVELTELAEIIDDYIQECFRLEAEKNSQIDTCKTAGHLGKLDLTVNWPSTIFN